MAICIMGAFKTNKTIHPKVLTMKKTSISLFLFLLGLQSPAYGMQKCSPINGPKKKEAIRDSLQTHEVQLSPVIDTSREFVRYRTLQIAAQMVYEQEQARLKYGCDIPRSRKMRQYYPANQPKVHSSTIRSRSGQFFRTCEIKTNYQIELEDHLKKIYTNPADLHAHVFHEIIIDEYEDWESDVRIFEKKQERKRKEREKKKHQAYLAQMAANIHAPKVYAQELKMIAAKAAYSTNRQAALSEEEWPTLKAAMIKKNGN